jgi:O-antigen ligase
MSSATLRWRAHRSTAPNERLAVSPGRRLARGKAAAAAAGTTATAFVREGPYIGLLAFTAILFFRPQETIPLLAPLHIAELAALAAIGSLVFARLSKGETVVQWNPAIAGVFALGAVMAATVPFSYWPGGAFGVLKDDYSKIIVIFVLLIATLRKPAHVAELTGLIVGACGYLSARGIANYLRGVNLVEGGRMGGPVGGIFGNPNDFALNLVVFVPLAVFCMLESRTRLRRAAAAVCTLVMLAGIVFTKSRGGFLGLAAMLPMLVFVNRRRINPAVAVALFIATLAAVPMLPSSFWARMASITDESRDPTGSRESRRIAMREAYEAFLEHPVTGVGAGQFKNYNPKLRREHWRETHNAPLQVAAELGIFGLAAFTFLVVYGFTVMYVSRVRLAPAPGKRGRRPQSKPADAAPESDDERRLMHTHAGALIAGATGWLVSSQFASVAYSWTFYYLLAFAAADYEYARSQGRVTKRRRSFAAAAVPGPEARPVRGTVRPAWRSAT